MTAASRPELDAQYRVLRDDAGLVEGIERRFVAVSGEEAAELLQGQLTNDIEALEPGGGCYATLLDRKGKLRADMRALRLAPGEILLDAEPAGADALVSHLGMYRVGREAEVEERGELALLRLLGPASDEVLGAATPPSEEHAHVEVELAGLPCRAVRTALGVDILSAAGSVPDLAAALGEAGAEAVEEQAAEILRVETGVPRFGLDMDTTTMPQEAGINERAVSFTKGCYIGQETVARLHYKGKPNRHLRGLRLEARAETGAPVLGAGRELGRLGTSVLSPAHGPIALAVLRREAEPGDRVEVEPAVAATVVELPFG